MFLVSVLFACGKTSDTPDPTTPEPEPAPIDEPGPSPEACDGADSDADGLVDCADPDCDATCDADGDGADGIAFGGDDCNDAVADVNPAATEICDGIDNDCDDAVDDGDNDVDAPSWYMDNDGDGFGDPDVSRAQCAPVFRAVRDATDCNDNRATIHPLAVEVCDAVDDDCDQLVDDDDPDLDLSTAGSWYVDGDGDGHGDDTTLTLACVAPAEHVSVGGDCDDGDPSAFDLRSWMEDGDGDGVGVDPATAPSCHPPGPGHVLETVLTDCDDVDPSVHPGAPDACEDGVDSNCDTLDCVTCTEIRVGILPGSNLLAQDPGVAWVSLAADSTPYGDCAVNAFDIPGGFTFATIEAAAPDVLWAPNSAAYIAYSAVEKQAIRDWVDLGHGLVTTYITSYYTADNGDLYDLVGIDPSAVAQTYIACQTTASLVDPGHPLATGLPVQFPLMSHPYAQQAAVPWVDALLPGATLVMSSADALNVAVAYQGSVGRGVMFSGLPEYAPPGPEAYRAVYNAVFWAGGYAP